MKTRPLLMLAVITVVFISGCSNKETQQQQNNAQQDKQHQTTGLRKGVSVSPRSFEGDDFVNFLEKVKETQDVLLWAGDWIEVHEEGSFGFRGRSPYIGVS